MNHESYDFGVIGPGFLNQVPTLLSTYYDATCTLWD